MQICPNLRRLPITIGKFYDTHNNNTVKLRTDIVV